MTYQFDLEEHPAYLHAKATGEHSAQNVARFLKDAYEACVARGQTSVLLEVNLAGTSLEFSSIYEVISSRSAAGTKLKRVAYVDATTRSPERMRFAETVALNRGVNVRLFHNLDDARRWMLDPPK
ncbi:hypothetical protein BWI17_00545 [Betaproteobacteria bacterium GR16-43]|nr:hypothetical protein BWI17_00545 [Betaproteobacteria bacterium GR16-43]